MSLKMCDSDRILALQKKTPESAKSTNSGVYVVIVSGFEPLAFRLGATL